MVVLAVAIVTTCGRTADKSPIPMEAAQLKALELVREVYGEQWENAETPAEKRALANKLIQQSASSTDLTNRYAVLKVACDIACEAGDVATAFRAIKQTAKQFDIDQYRAKGNAMSRAAKGAKSREQHQEIAECSLNLTDEAVDGDDFAAARYLANLAVEAARKARHGTLVKQAVARSEAVEEIARAYDRDRIKEHQATLIIDPVDPDANAAVGKYLCFTKGEWGKGALKLALGSDATLKELAEKEIADTPDSLALGDGWWELAEQHEGIAKRNIQTRAANCYRKALPGLSPLQKAKVEKRLAEVEGKLAAEATDDRFTRDGWISIFDGKSLKGWRADQNPQHWSVEDGAIMGRNQRGEPSHLYYERIYSDFTFESDVQVTTGNSGLYIRAARRLPAPAGYEVEIFAGVKDGGLTGSLDGIVEIRRMVTKPGRWFRLRVIAQDNRIRVVIDDETVVDYVDKTQTHRRGYLALQCWRGTTDVRFRNLRVKPLN